MKVEQVETVKLIPYARNAKKHDDAQVASIAGSIKEFGFNNPVLIDKDNCIIAGHGRVLAAQKLELKEVPCLRISHLSENQKRAYILADNRLAELGGGWDEDMLKIELDDIDFAEFENFELGDLGELDINNTIEKPMVSIQLDVNPLLEKAKAINKIWNVKSGDLWEIGEHKLLCGNSSIITAFGNLDDFLFLGDPPYEMDAQEQSKIINLSKNVCIWFGSFPPMGNVIKHTNKKIQYDIAWLTGGRGLLPNPNFIIPQHKNIFIFADKLPELNFNGARYLDKKKLCSVIDVEYDDVEKKHKHMKPLNMIMALIASYTPTYIFDPFLGSGTTMVAAENLKRKCYGVEIMAEYCAVVLERMKETFPTIKIHKTESIR
jgi:hypothetical protein